MQKLSQFREFLSFNVFPYLGIGGIATRRKLANQFISGNGVEIGALHTPLKLKKTVDVKYVDLIDYETAIKKFPELNPKKLVRPDYVDNGFELNSIAGETQDFIIANHVLEHSPNPINVLKTWVSKLKPKGVLFISVPIAEMCFDRGRELTTVDHFLDDYLLVSEGKYELFLEKNLKHYEEWIAFSEPNILQMRGIKNDKLTEQQRSERALMLSKNDNVEIHFHTFSLLSFQQLLNTFIEKIQQDTSIKLVVQNKAELIAVLQKAS